MAVAHGRVTTFKIDDTSDTEQNLTTYVTDVNMTFARAVAQTTAKGQESHTKIAGHRDHSFSVTGNWDSTATTGPDEVLQARQADGGARGFEIGFEGDATGDVIYTGNAILTSYVPSSPLEGIVTYTADFDVSGDVTRSTVSA